VATRTEILEHVVDLNDVRVTKRQKEPRFLLPFGLGLVFGLEPAPLPRPNWSVKRVLMLKMTSSQISVTQQAQMPEGEGQMPRTFSRSS
jgi:hypothetical protein